MNLKPLKWLAIILVFAAVTLLVTYLIPAPTDNAFSINLIPRYIVSFVFIAFLPGYCLVHLLFAGKNRLDFVEELVLSVALSFGLDALVGLFLGLSPIKLTFTSITVSLSVLVLALAILAFARKRRESREPNMQSSQHVSA